MTIQMYVRLPLIIDLLSPAMFSFQRKRLADLGTPWMEMVAGFSQGFATLADLMIIGALFSALRPNRNPRMKKYVLWKYKSMLNIE
jgi:hypothetical protein